MKRESLVSITDFQKKKFWIFSKKRVDSKKIPIEKFWKVKSWRLCSSSLLPALDSALKPLSTD